MAQLAKSKGGRRASIRLALAWWLSLERRVPGAELSPPTPLIHATVRRSACALHHRENGGWRTLPDFRWQRHQTLTDVFVRAPACPCLRAVLRYPALSMDCLLLTSTTPVPTSFSAPNMPSSAVCLGVHRRVERELLATTRMLTMMISEEMTATRTHWPSQPSI